MPPEAKALEQNTRPCGAVAAKQLRAMGIWAHQTGGVTKANTLYAWFAYFKVSSLIDLIYQTDMKRARFRADSTPYDDKLASCEHLRCHKPPLSSFGATYSGVNKRRRTLIEDADNKDIPSSADGSAPSDASSSSMAVDKHAIARKRKRSRERSRRSKPPSKPSNDEAMDVDSTDAPKSLPTPGTRSTSRTTLPSRKAEDDLHPKMDKAEVSLPLHRAVVEITTATDGPSRLGMYVVVNDSNTPTHGMQAEILEPKGGGLGMRNPSPNNEQKETLW